MALDELTGAHPELRTAVTFALRAVADERPADPVTVLAEKLLEFNARNGGSGGDASGEPAPGGSSSARGGSADARRAGGGAGGAAGGDEDDDAERARLAAARSRGKTRRQVVFSEPVKLDKDFVPVVVPKSDEEKAEISAVLAANILFKGMDSDASRLIVDAMVPKAFPEGETIIRQGDPGDFYYVISEGTCAIFVNGKKVVEMGKGRGFGDLALMYDAPRAATVTAQSAVKAWAVDRDTFKHIMVGTTIRKRELYESFLRGVPILSTLTREEVLTIADALVPETIPAGTVVVRQGESGASADRFYIVEDGELKAEIAGVPGEVCARLRAGAYFGERALITDMPRAATVTTCAESKLLAMDRASFLRLLGPITELLARNMEVYARYTTAPSASAAAAASTATAGGGGGGKSAASAGSPLPHDADLSPSPSPRGSPRPRSAGPTGAGAGDD